MAVEERAASSSDSESDDAPRAPEAESPPATAVVTGDSADGPTDDSAHRSRDSVAAGSDRLAPWIAILASSLLTLRASSESALPDGLVWIVIVALAALWWWRVPRDPSGVLGRVMLPLSALLLSAAVGLPWQDSRDLEDWAAVARAGHDRAWLELDRTAEALAAELGPHLATELARDDRSREAVDARHLRSEVLLDRLAALGGENDAFGAPTAILLDADLEAVAWHGPGLLHEPGGWELPRAGRAHRRSQTAVTLLSVREIDADPRPWRIIVGRSHTYDDFPFAELPEGVRTEEHRAREGKQPRYWRLRWSIASKADPGSTDTERASSERGDISGAPAEPGMGDGPFLHLVFEESKAGSRGTDPGEGARLVDDGESAGDPSLAGAPEEPRAELRRKGKKWKSVDTGRPLLWAAVASAFLALFTGLRTLFAVPVAGHRFWRSSGAVAAFVVGGSCLAAILGVPGPVVGVVAAALFVLGLATTFGPFMAPFADSSRRFEPESDPRQGWPRAALAAAGWSVCFGIAWLYQDLVGAIDLSDFERWGLEALWLRLAMGVGMLAVLLAIGGRPRAEAGRGSRAHEPAAATGGFEASGSGDEPPGAGAFVLAIVLGAMAGAFVDSPVLAIPLALMAAAAAGIYRQARSSWSGGASRSGGGNRGLGPRELGGAVLLASILGVVAWQIADRVAIKQQLEHVYLPAMAPPTGEELNAILVELDRAVSELDLAEILAPPVEEPSGLRDLAFVLWRHLPLSARDGLSALVVESSEGELSSFAFGLGVDRAGIPMPESPRWPVPNSTAWRDSLLVGEGELRLSGQPWGQVRYWFLPRPGFRGSADETEELERNLVRGKPRKETADGLPAEARYGLFDLDGRAASSPWDEAPPLPREVSLGDVRSGLLDTPDGSHWFWLDRGIDGIETLFLPVLGPREALERTGFAVVGLLPLLLLLVGIGWLSGAPRPDLTELIRSALRSYSRRLSLVYTVLLLVPLIALNLILLRSFAERLQEEQLAEAQNAMLTARTLLVDYLQGLGSGFLIETQVNRELLEWIGGLVQHQVNLYWGSRLYASSQQELFTAGLLPHRIPGEIFDRLTLLGYDMEFRRQRAGDLAYLEVYAPFDVPGIVSSQQGLFLSVPLLEQEEEVARQVTVLRRRALLVTSGLFLALLAVGGRLSRSFTRPIVQLIEGTRRIARGEPFGKLEPKETELSALATAIGAMADQVELGRRRLRGEKRFVERVVANITSAVVSIDLHGQVVLQNSIAAERLGTREGEPLDARLADDAALKPIRDFVAEVRGSEQPRGRQVKLRPTGEKVDVLEWTLTFVPIPGDEDPAALLVVDDATEVLRGQRLEAWAEMARIIAHEIKNPLTPIQLSTEHLRQVWRSDPERLDEVVERCTANILSNVEELRSIASEFSIYSRIPKAEPEPGNLVAFASELVANYEHAAVSDAGASATLRPGPSEVWARFDGKLLGRAVRNLLENARRAAGEGGTVEVAITRSVDDTGRRAAQIRVLDSGPGVDPQKLERIFEPYFSTYETGTGLGLAITRRIVDEHGGTIEARNRPEGGLAVLVTIPEISAPEHPPQAPDSVS